MMLGDPERRALQPWAEGGGCPLKRGVPPPPGWHPLQTATEMFDLSLKKWEKEEEGKKEATKATPRERGREAPGGVGGVGGKV